MRELILVADDDPFDLKLLSEVCENAGHAVVAAADGPACLEAVARSRPSLVLLDASIPRVDGVEVCRILKSDRLLQRIPVIIVAAATDQDGRARGLAAGADDWVTKPIRLLELQQRIRSALELGKAQRDLHVAHGRLEELEVGPASRAQHVGTLHQMQLSLDYEFMRAARYGHPLCIVAIGLPLLAELRRELGIDGSEQALAELQRGLRDALRGTDLLFRPDDDVFVVLLVETAEDGARAVIERISRDVSASHLLRAVLGAAIFPDPHVSTGADLLEAARAQLARAESTRHRIATTWGWEG